MLTLSLTEAAVLLSLIAGAGPAADAAPGRPLGGEPFVAAPGMASVARHPSFEPPLPAWSPPPDRTGSATDASSTRERNASVLEDAGERNKQLAEIRDQAFARRSQPAYDSDDQRARLDALIRRLDGEREVLGVEIKLRKAIERAYAVAAAATPPPANLDAVPPVRNALQALKTHRTEHGAHYPSGKLSAGCVECGRKSLGSVLPWVGRTSEETLARINRELATRISFDALSRFEGGQWRRPYIPCSKGKVAGNSGVTVATGFDLGQVLPAHVDAMTIPAAVRSKIRRFAGTRYKGQDCQAARDAMTRLGNVTLDQREADEIDYHVKWKHLSEARKSWDTTVPSGGQRFTQLTRAQQTVLFSRTFHQGTGMPESKVAKAFYGAAQRGDWIAAEQELRDYPVKEDWYKERVRAEANLLKKERLAS